MRLLLMRMQRFKTLNYRFSPHIKRNALKRTIKCGAIASTLLNSHRKQQAKNFRRLDIYSILLGNTAYYRFTNLQ